MRVVYDPVVGFAQESEGSGAVATHDIPDSEWKAYRTLVDAANALEDRFVAGYAIEADEFASVRGILTDEQIETLKGLGVSMSDVPAGKVYMETTPEPKAISAEQAAFQIIERNKHKCQHRNQTGPFSDGTVRCRDCGGILYGGTGVKTVDNPDDPRHFHNPGSVKPDSFNGTV